MNTSLPDSPIEIETAPQPTATVIWLHGLGADGYDFAGIVPELKLPPNNSVRFVFPHAPYRPVTLNNGYVMRAWYDITLTEQGFSQNESDIATSVHAVYELVSREVARGILSSRIVLAGFSQGGVIAVHAGLCSHERVAGIMVLSAPVPEVHQLVKRATSTIRETPIFLAHGTRDPMVPFAYAEATRIAFQENGYNVEWHAYPMEHSVVPAEIDAIGRWLQKVLF